MTRLLVCPPDFYRIDYEINPWMNRENAVEHPRAVSQWQDLMETLDTKVGVTLERMTPVKGLPDLVFTANAGVVVDGIAVPSRFRHPERQREQTYFEEWFAAHGFQLKLLKKSVYFEGAGDMLGVPDLWLGGYRKRSDIGAYNQLSELFDREIIPVELVDDRFYHLDTCFCPLTNGDVLYFPDAFDRYAQAVISDRLESDRRLAVPEREALRFACNAVCVGKKVVLPAGCLDTVKMLK
ncbi:MAG: dimethylarginine dimethylaminohydrolase family protein, partial [Thermoanaerobaculia bacterium]